MEFKPKSIKKDAPEVERVVPPEKGRAAQRKTAEKLHKSYNSRRRIVAVLTVIGKLCLLVVTTALLLSSLFFAYTSDRFFVRTVSVEGCNHVDPRNVEEIIRREFPANILRIDLPGLRSRLEQESWIKRVEIRRVLPSDLVITVQERNPAVILEMRGELMVADVEGVLLDRYDGRYGKLDVPVFRGVLGDDEAGYRTYQDENAARVLQGLKMLSELQAGSAEVAGRISEVDVSDKGNLKVMLIDDTAEIILGNRDFLKRFRRLLTNMDGYRQAKLEHGEMASVDLRFDGQIVYEPRRTSAESDSPRQ